MRKNRLYLIAIILIGLIFIILMYMYNGITLKTYYQNGGLKSITEYKYFKLHGINIDFYPNGKVLDRLCYNKGALCDSSLFFFEDGSIKGVVYYQNGFEQGLARWYYNNGNIEQIVEWEKGQSNGIEIHYFANKNIMISGYNVNGKKSGLWKYYTLDGQLERIQSFSNDSLTLDSLIVM